MSLDPADVLGRLEAEAPERPTRPGPRPVVRVSVGPGAHDAGDSPESSGSAPARSVRLLGLEEIATRPLPTWAVYLLVQGISVLYGAPGSFKTFLAISWAVCIASGRRWLGRRVSPGAVVFVVGEGSMRSFYHRVRVAALALGVPAAEVHRLPIFATEGAVDLGKWDGVQAQQFRSAVLETASRVGTIAAVFVDTVSRCLPGDENAQEVMGSFIRCNDTLRADLGGPAIVLIHHTNAEGSRERGSSVLAGAADAILRITAGAPDLLGRVPLALHAEKLKEADAGPGRDPVARLLAVRAIVEDHDGNPVLDEEGEPLTTRYLIEASPDTPTAEKSLDDALIDAIPVGGVSASRLSANLKRRKASVLGDLQRLARAGRVRAEGSGGKARWVLTTSSAGSESVPELWEPEHLSVPPVPGPIRPGPGTDAGTDGGTE